MRNLIFILMIVIVNNAFSQFTPVINTYMYNGLSINPAYAGSRECLSIVAHHRSQWTGVDGAPMTDYINAHSPLGKNHAIGINIFNDVIGVNNHTGFYPSYSYTLRFKKTHRLAFGISAGLSFVSTDETKVTTIENNDIFFEKNNQLYAPNFGTGFYYYNEKFYFGASAPLIYTKAINQPSNNALQLRLNNNVYTAIAGFILNFGNNFKLKPNALFSYLDGFSTTNLNLTAYINDKYYLGGGLINTDAFSAMVGMQIREKFDIAYTYIHQTGRLKNAFGGTHEIMLRYELKKKVNSLNSRYF